ncbi:MAG: DUF1272 domain-containing protein [Saprospiraceae bacterium]|nr:DUF1272 domain-containing protein [Saprospiraceae bacterium]
MLKLKPTCENCNAPLPPKSTKAMICSFECTFCKECVEQVLENVCPNCGGGFEPRPIRPSTKLDQYPASNEVYYKPVDLEALKELKNKLGKP